MGGLWAAAKKDKVAILALTFIVTFLAVISLFSLQWDRWAIPLIPFLILLIAWLIEKVTSLISTEEKHRSSIRLATFLVLASCLVLPLLFQSVQTAKAMAGEDTRTIAHDWMLENIPAQSKILMEKYAPIFDKNSFIFYYVDEYGILQEFDPIATYKQNFKPYGHIGAVKDPSTIFLNQIDYLVLSSPYNRYLEVAERYPYEVGVYQQLIESSELIFQASPIPGEVAGPDVFVFKIIR